jgi:hypothetical protein
MRSVDDSPERLARLFVQMDGADVAAALAAKNDAARLLTAAELSFSAIAEQLEQRRLLMPPDIVAAIKRMDLPGEGDAAFVGARKLLVRVKLGFQHIAEALDHASVSPAEHAALAQEFAALRNTYLRQQSTIAGLKFIIGPTWAGGFLQRAWRWTLLLCAALMMAVLTFSAGRIFVDYGRGPLVQALGARSAQAVVQLPSSLPAAQPDMRWAVAVTTQPAVADSRREPAATPQSRSLSAAAPRRRAEQMTDEYGERPRFRARSNCWGGVGDCVWGAYRY